jgi:hypothetical protein
MSSPADSPDDVYLLPTKLAVACRDVLGVDGVGLSAISVQIQVPLGASDQVAVAAERLQFTVGEGPCIAALRDRTEVRVSAEDIERRWPAFYDELRAATPYRSIAAVPMQITRDLAGAVDLYFRDPTGAFSVDLGAAGEAAMTIAATLRAASGSTLPSIHAAEVDVPSWLYSATARHRLRTWIAAGIVMAQAGLTGSDALARIRSYAYGQQQDLLDVTEAIISGEVRF